MQSRAFEYMVDKHSRSSLAVSARNCDLLRVAKFGSKRKFAYNERIIKARVKQKILICFNSGAQYYYIRSVEYARTVGGVFRLLVVIVNYGFCALFSHQFVCSQTAYSRAVYHDVFADKSHIVLANIKVRAPPIILTTKYIVTIFDSCNPFISR